MLAVIGTLAIELCFITDREAFAMKILSGVMSLAAVFCTIAVVVFGIKGDDRDWMPDPEHNFLSWSFGLAVAGVFCHWIAAVLFLVESRTLYDRENKRDRSFHLEPKA
jgi:formate hydrogenlyase subunit 3/multisubunit Na+/H+ antiporter MnhD subunit